MTEDERLRFVGMIFVLSLATVVFFCLTIYSFYMSYQLQKHGQLTTAKIHERTSFTPGSYKYSVDYSIADTTYNGEFHSDFNCIGCDSVRIVFLPSDKTAIAFAFERGIGIKNYVMVAVVVLLVGMLIFAIKRPEQFVRFPDGDVGR